MQLQEYFKIEINPDLTAKIVFTYANKPKEAWGRGEFPLPGRAGLLIEETGFLSTDVRNERDGVSVARPSHANPNLAEHWYRTDYWSLLSFIYEQRHDLELVRNVIDNALIAAGEAEDVARNQLEIAKGKATKLRKNYRLGLDTAKLLSGLTSKLGLNETAIVELAVRRLAELEKINL